MAKYTVKSGDTLSGIANKFNTTISAIMKENPIITNKNVIRTGWILCIGETGKQEPETVPAPVAPAAPTKDYAAIGLKVEKCIQKIATLDEFKELEKLL